MSALHDAVERNDLDEVRRILEELEGDPNLCFRRGSRYITPLYLAATLGHEEMAALLLRRGARPFSDGEERDDLMAAVASAGHVRVFEMLLDAGLDPELEDGAAVSDNAFLSAASEGHEQIVRLLLDRGAKIAQTDMWGRTALHLAGEDGHEAVVDLLIERGLAPEPSSAYLASFAKGGLITWVRRLLDLGADSNSMDQFGWSALHAAVSARSEVIVRLLLDAGADPAFARRASTERDKGVTVLHEASASSSISIVRLLVDRGAEPDARAADGRTPLYDAVEGALSRRDDPSEAKEIVRYLLELGADPNPVRAGEEELELSAIHALECALSQGMRGIAELLMEYGANPSPPAKYVAGFAASGFLDLVEEMLRNGVDPDSPDSEGAPPLFLVSGPWASAAEADGLGDGSELLESQEEQAPRRRMMALLLEHGANPNGASGFSPLAVAARHGAVKEVELLLDHGASPDGDEQVPLVEAVANEHLDTIRLLLQRGANPNQEDERGETALVTAVELDSRVAAKLLLENGAGPNNRSAADGLTALHVAASIGRRNLVELLLQFGADPRLRSEDGETPASIARRLYYDEVAKTLEAAEMGR